MTYRESIGFLSSLIDYERWVHRDYEFKLDNYRFFLKSIGNPQKKLKRVVLVAGTKGKGSTAAMIAEILKAHGEKVGLYTSPHLVDYRERIRVDGRMIPQSRFSGILDELKPNILGYHPRITFFEALTTIAFLYFLNENTSVNVLEIGLGGRLDATNVTDPELAVITRIGYDHTHILGRTLKSIAQEKCGILRKKKPAVIAAQRPRVKTVIKKNIRDKESVGIWWKEEFSAHLLKENLKHIKMSYEGINLRGEFSLPMLGAHQMENAATALAASEMLIHGINLSHTGEALAGLKLPARIDFFSREPGIILDMSHNQESAMTLRKVLDKHFFHHPRRILIIGTTRQKDKRSILKILVSFFTEVYVTQAKLVRAEPKENLLTLCRELYADCRSADSVEDALKEILPTLDKEDLLVVSGSVYVTGEALKILKSRKRTSQR